MGTWDGGRCWNPITPDVNPIYSKNLHTNRLTFSLCQHIENYIELSDIARFYPSFENCVTGSKTIPLTKSLLGWYSSNTIQLALIHLCAFCKDIFNALYKKFTMLEDIEQPGLATMTMDNFRHKKTRLQRSDKDKWDNFMTGRKKCCNKGLGGKAEMMFYQLQSHLPTLMELQQWDKSKADLQ